MVCSVAELHPTSSGPCMHQSIKCFVSHPPPLSGKSVGRSVGRSEVGPKKKKEKRELVKNSDRSFSSTEILCSFKCHFKRCLKTFYESDSFARGYRVHLGCGNKN